MRQDKPQRTASLLLAIALALALAPFTTSCAPKATEAIDAIDAGKDAASEADAAAASKDAEEATARRAALLAIEHRRTAKEITPSDQQSRDVNVRRAAARALARIGGEDAQQGLHRALADEDNEVVTWAAYGLGFSCKGHEKENVAALVARSLSLDLAEKKDEDAGSNGQTALAPGLDARLAIARAVGRCAGEQSEPTLVAWLSGSAGQASAASFALGDYGIVRERLREETIAALLNVAAGSASSAPLPEALFPIARQENVPLTVLGRLREVASARLAQPGPYRFFAVRALGRAGADAAPDLGRVLSSPALFSSAERSEATRALHKIGAAGRRAIEAALPALMPPSDPIALSAAGEDLIVLHAALEALDGPGKSQKQLRELATLAPPTDAPITLQRRLSWVRCTAAMLLAGTDARDPLLVACDLTTPKQGDAAAPTKGQPGSIGARAIVKVLDRAPIEGARLTTFRAIAKGNDLRAKEAALELLGTHEELEGEAKALLEETIVAKEPGLVASAAGVIAQKPHLASEPEKKRKKRAKRKRDDEEDEKDKPALRPPSPAIVKAIVDALGRADVDNDAELATSMIDAAGALGLKEVSPRLEELCHSSWPEIRKKTAKAIALITGKAPTCDAPVAGGPLPSELQSLAAGQVKITLTTDAGEMALLLDATIAPVAVTRIADLVRAGYYDGMVVHRVVPGFVTQLGAPFGDGYGGPAGKPSLRCETSPLPFEPLTVGVALAGRDTGSSQIYVMHARHPHLDGQYAWIGRATGQWSAFVDGDVVQKATVTP